MSVASSADAEDIGQGVARAHAAEPPLSRQAQLGWMVVVAGPTLYLSFNSGGFFVTATALATIAVLLGLVVHVTTAAQPFAGVGRAAAVMIAGLGLFAAWTLLSSRWSDAAARALIEFDRALLYAAVATAFAALPARATRVRAMLAGLVLAIAVIGVVALITRLLPEVWPISPGVEPNRLSYPLTYWNALGLLVGAGAVGALHFASSARERASVRVLATLLLPLLATVLYFTLSRGAMAVTLFGGAVFLALARPRGALPALLAAVPPSAAVLLVAYHADALTTETPTTAEGIVQGQRVALALAGAVVATAVLRLALVPLERRLRAPRVRLPVPSWLAVVVAVAVIAAAAVASGVAERAIESFGDSEEIARQSDERSRLTSLSNNGRFDHWRVALDAFESQPLRGRGAGTYQLAWARGRATDFTVNDGHSLYLEVLGELGVVGLVLVVIPIVALLLALILRARGPGRAPHAAAFALTLMWTIHAGIDWDWEMPAVTWWVLALGAAAIASTASPEAGGGGVIARGTPRLVLGLGCLLLAVTPAVMALSQIQLDRAARAFERGDCETAIDHSLASISVLGVRPQPYALIALCDLRLGADELALRMIDRAIARDPYDWSYHYARALARAAAGRDPRPAARRAHDLNPLDPRTAYALQLYAGGDRRAWRERAHAAPPPW